MSAPTKQSFADKCVPKLELGDEGEKQRFAASGKTSAPAFCSAAVLRRFWLRMARSPRMPPASRGTVAALESGAAAPHSKTLPRDFPRDQAPAWSRPCLGSSASPGGHREGARPVDPRRRSRASQTSAFPSWSLGTRGNEAADTSCAARRRAASLPSAGRSWSFGAGGKLPSGDLLVQFINLNGWLTF